MKARRFFAAVIILFLGSAIGFGRLGEKESELILRYGPVVSRTSSASNEVTLGFYKAEIEIYASMWPSQACHRIRFVKGRHFEDHEIALLLAKNGGLWVETPHPFDVAKTWADQTYGRLAVLHSGFPSTQELTIAESPIPSPNQKGSIREF